jgi:hypothetical protein
MKTYWLMIGCSVALIAAVFCIVNYRASMRDLTGQPQNTRQVQKQSPDKGIIDKKPVSETPDSAIVSKSFLFSGRKILANPALHIPIQSYLTLAIIFSRRDCLATVL